MFILTFKMPRNTSKPRVSNSWDKYSISGVMSHGNVHFAFFKTPIKTKNLSPEQLLSHLATHQGCNKLGLVIDLTDSDKYYDPNEFVALNVVHYKINCTGMCVPEEDIVKHFETIVSRFVKEHSYKKKTFVGVHCMNGVNRTGYLVCRYLMDMLNFDVVRAINCFQEKRGHDIEHDCIRNALLSHVPNSNINNTEKKPCCVM